jgi:hypothetical protein
VIPCFSDGGMGDDETAKSMVGRGGGWGVRGRGCLGSLLEMLRVCLVARVGNLTSYKLSLAMLSRYKLVLLCYVW